MPSVQLNKAGYKVWILTDTGRDITDKLPNIAEEARTKIPFTVCVLDCEPADRKKILAKVPWGGSIHPIKYKLVKADGVIAAIKEMTTSEGAMIKDATSRYDRSGEGWYKWKKQYEIDAQVIAVDKKPDGYIYTCKVGNITIGDTYITITAIARNFFRSGWKGFSGYHSGYSFIISS